MCGRTLRSIFAAAPLLLIVSSSVALPILAVKPPARLLPAPLDEFPIGAVAADFELADQDGRPLRLSSLRGQPVLLMVFLGSWCPYCRGQLAALAEAARAVDPAAPRILAVSTDPPEVLAALRRARDLPFTLLSDPEQRAIPVCGTSMHCLVAIDRSGKIRWGGFNENWRTPPPYGDVLRFVSGLP